jgi:hypothetical protein
METEEFDDPADDDGVTAYRASARAALDQIASQVKDALVEQQIDLDLFFVSPSSESLLCFGTMSDPADELWDKVSSLVSSIVSGAVGLDRVRSRTVVCAATGSIADQQPHAASVQPDEPSTSQPAPETAGADR